MKHTIIILVLSVIALSFPPLVNADEVRMMIWHPQINTRDTEMVNKIEIFIDYLNERLEWDHITYSIVQTPEQAADYFNQYRPAIGLVDKNYWRRYRRTILPGRIWLTANHLRKPPRPPDLFVGSGQIAPDVASTVLLEGDRYKTYREKKKKKKEDFDPLSFLGMKSSRTLKVSPSLSDKELVRGLMMMTRGAGGLFGLPQLKPSNTESVVAVFSKNISDRNPIRDSLLNMNYDPVGKEILESLRIKRFTSSRR